MSDQGPFPDRRDDFGLIETLLWTPEGGFGLLREHLSRLRASSAALGFRYDEGKVEEALTAAVPTDATSPARLRVRLVLSRDGSLEVSATPIDAIPPETIWRVALAEARFSSDNPLLRHKTTRRALYEDELARAMKEKGADEVLFLNERDELCESARCNLFVPEGGILLTPPLSSGLLPGTLRASLIALGRAREAVLRLPDLPGTFFLGNSVRGLVQARLSDWPPRDQLSPPSI
jgi:4-amino-4-deoxychorismate lyase